MTATPKKPRATKARALSPEQIEEALGRVEVPIGGTELAAQRARAGDRETAIFMLKIAADLVAKGEALTGQLTPVRNYLVQALEELAKAGAIPDARKRATAVLKALNLAPRGQNRFIDEGRNIRIVRLVQALHDNGWKRSTAARYCAFEEAARIIRQHGGDLDTAGVESVWKNRAKR